MYLVSVDQMGREDIAAAAAAHRELGPSYDDALAEGLVERIGSEIDKRVDARLGQRGGAPAQAAKDGQLSPAVRASWEVIVLGLGSMAIGGITAGNLLSTPYGPGRVAIVVVIWIIIGVINIAYARRR